MTIIINPGSGPVADASEENAIENIKHLITDITKPSKDPHGELHWLRVTSLDEGGRFGFMVWLDLYGGDFHGHYVEMPGLPLDQVRWVDSPDQNIWNFPRLYVDGSSWVWKFAVSSMTFSCGEEAER